MRLLLFASFGAGACFALSGAPRDLWGVGLLGGLGWLLALEHGVFRRGARSAGFRGALSGLLFGAGANAVALGWSVGLLERFGGFPAPVAWATSALLWLAQGIPHALGTATAAVLGALLARRGRSGVGPWLLPPATVVFLGLVPAVFPWRPGAGLLPVPALVQIADLGGEPLVDLVLLTTLVAAAEALRRPGTRGALRAGAVAVALPGLVLAYGFPRLAAVEAARAGAPRVQVGLVQPNVPVGGKRDPERRASRRRELHRATLSLEAAGAELVVWPETAHPYPLGREARSDLPWPWSLRPSRGRVPLLAGVITVGTDPGRDPPPRYNSVAAVGPDGAILGVSDKVVLVPFGERVPLCPAVPGLAAIAGGSCGLTPGRRPEVLRPAPGLRAGVLNCYEDVLGHQARWVARDEPDLLVNVTNDAWFGDTSEPALHLAVSRFRAIEARRELVRSTNTGMTAHVAATGAIVARAPAFTATELLVDVPLLASPPTLWVRWGDWVSLTSAALVVGAMVTAFAPRRRRDQPSGSTKRTSKTESQSFPVT